MSVYNNSGKLESIKSYKPTAVVAPQNTGERYGWGEDYDDLANDLVWEPALADEYGCIPLGDGLLTTKVIAEEAAKEIADSLRVALGV